MDVTKFPVFPAAPEVAYYQSKIDNSVGHRPDDEGPDTITRALPMRARTIVEVDNERFLVSLYLNSFNGARGWRVGVGRVEVEAEEGGAPITLDRLRQIPVREIARAALREWSFNTDKSDVTDAQAERLLRGGNERRGTAEDRWRQAAEAYLAAQREGRPTTVAVATALNLGTDRAGQDRARSLIRRARDKGFLPPDQTRRGKAKQTSNHQEDR